MASVASVSARSSGDVAEHDDDVVLAVEVVGERGERHADGVAGAALARAARRTRPGRRCRAAPGAVLVDVLGAVADHHHDPVERQRARARRARAAASAARTAGAAPSACDDCMRVPSPAASTTALSGSDWFAICGSHSSAGCSAGARVARGRGFEPRLGTPKDPVLPLHHPRTSPSTLLVGLAGSCTVCGLSGRRLALHAAMGSLIKKRRKRMRKKKHKKLLKRTRWQRRQQGR